MTLMRQSVLALILSLPLGFANTSAGEGKMSPQVKDSEEIAQRVSVRRGYGHGGRYDGRRAVNRYPYGRNGWRYGGYYYNYGYPGYGYQTPYYYSNPYYYRYYTPSEETETSQYYYYGY
jgi:hypothetical protein